MSNNIHIYKVNCFWGNANKTTPKVMNDVHSNEVFLKI